MGAGTGLYRKCWNIKQTWQQLHLKSIQNDKLMLITPFLFQVYLHLKLLFSTFQHCFLDTNKPFCLNIQKLVLLLQWLKEQELFLLKHFQVNFFFMYIFLQTAFYFGYQRFLQNTFLLNYAEPFDTISWIMILLISIQVAAFVIFLFEWLSPSGYNMGLKPAKGMLESFANDF